MEETCGAPTVFQSGPYLAAYKRGFGAGKVFHRLRVGGHSAHSTQHSALEGAEAFLMARGLGLRRLEWWGAGIHDIGGAAVSTPHAAEALWHKIEALARHYDGAHLAQIEAASPFVELAARCGWQVEEAETCPVLTLPATWDDYVRSLGRNMREQIKRYPKRLEKRFAVEHELARTPAEVERALSDLFVLHGKRWRARGQSGVLVLPSRQKFQRAVCRAFLQRGWLRLWTLRLNGRAVCVLLNYFFNGRYYFFIGGFEPEMMRLSVGTCLFARVLRHAIEEGASEFDFLRGAEEYKYRLGAVDRPYKTVSTFSPTARGRLLQKQVHLETALMRRLHQRFGAAGTAASRLENGS